MKNLKEFMKSLAFSDALIIEMLAYKLEKERYEYYKKLFIDDETGFYEEIGDDEQKLALYLYINFAMDLEDFIKSKIKANFKYKSIAKFFDVDKIFYDTISDIRIWQEVYERRSGEIGLIELEWLSNSLKGRLFRLGRLQFEPDKLKNAIHVHIPEGERLDKKECEKAFELAGKLFMDFKYFDCLSWLLSPKILGLLSENSGIREFQSLFEIKDIKYDMKQASERVLFDSPNKNETSLQKKLKEYLKNNEDPGMGYGIREIRA